MSDLCAISALLECALLSSRKLAACMRCPSLDISSDGSTASTLLGWPLYTCSQSSLDIPWPSCLSLSSERLNCQCTD